MSFIPENHPTMFQCRICRCRFLGPDFDPVTATLACPACGVAWQYVGEVSEAEVIQEFYALVEANWSRAVRQFFSSLFD